MILRFITSRLALAAAVMAGLATGISGRAAVHDLYVCASFNNGSRVMGAKDGSSNGVFRLGKDGFEHIGINFGMTISATFDPRDSNVFYVACLSGVLRTLDGGKTWRLVTSWDHTEPKSIAVDRRDPDTVYTGLPDGLIVSHDRGQTWERSERGLPERGKYTQVVQVDRAKKGRVLIGCESGIYLSEDGAKNWKRVFETTDTVDDIQQSPSQPKRWIAVTQSAGAVESLDNGLNWKPIKSVPADRALYNVTFDARDSQRIAIASWGKGILVSEDSGVTWTPRNDGLPATAHVWRAAIDPDSQYLFVSIYGQGLYASSDFGKTWKQAGMEGASVQTFTFVPRR